jgi:hypothetical protein
MTMLQVWIRSGRIAQLTSRERAGHQAEGVLQGEVSSELNVAGCSVPLLNMLFAGDRNVAMSSSEEKLHELKARQRAPIATPTDLDAAATKDIAAVMNGMLADAFALYLKRKNFHWHMSGPHFRDHHLLLDEQADQILAMTDPIAERIRKVGGSTLKSIGHVARM